MLAQTGEAPPRLSREREFRQPRRTEQAELYYPIRLSSRVLTLQHECGPVAQLDRASDFGSEGCGFKSCRDRQIAPMGMEKVRAPRSGPGGGRQEAGEAPRPRMGRGLPPIEARSRVAAPDERSLYGARACRAKPRSGSKHCEISRQSAHRRSRPVNTRTR